MWRRASSVESPISCFPSILLLHRRKPSIRRGNSLRRIFDNGSLRSSPYISTTFILFSVSVPVLSEQMIPTEPRVSTAGSFLIMVLTFTMRATPRARTMVTTAGSPSGIAATARDMATRSICRILRCWTTPRRKRAAQRTTATTLSIFPRSPRRFCRGVSSVGVSLIIPAILPSSVSIPVATTIPSALPFIASVDINATFFHSAMGIP